MRFTWPLALLSLLAVPLLLGVYLWQLRRRRRSAVQFSSIALIRAAMPRTSQWRRHVPFALFSLGLCSLGVASARPQASVKVPVARTSIILALDVSRSMCATDVPPNRLTVAQEAARAFVRAQPKGTRIGIVAFAGFAEVVVAPTTSKDDLIAAIDGLTTARGTVIGAAILKSLDAIAAVNPSVRPIGVDDPNAGGDSTDAVPSDTVPPDTVPPDSTGSSKARPPEGGYVPDIVVVLTDGANTRGVEPVDAAAEAVSRKVRVYTIGFGTSNPTDMVCSSAQLGGAGFDSGIGGGFGGGAGGGFGGGGFGGGGGMRRFLVIDEPTLQKVADLTGGNFYKAEDADQLKGVFSKLPKDVQLQKRNTELTAGFTALGALLAAVAMFLSLRWNRTP